MWPASPSVKAATLKIYEGLAASALSTMVLNEASPGAIGDSISLIVRQEASPQELRRHL